MIRINIYAYPGCVPSAVYGLADVFDIANWASHEKNPRSGKSGIFDTKIVTSHSDEVTAFNGTRIRAQAKLSDRNAKSDILIVPPWLGVPETILSNEANFIARLKQGECNTRHVTSVCTGSFLLAASGILTGKQATTHWYWSQRFRKMYPGVIFRPEKMVIDEGQIITAAGMTAYLNLALYLISRFESKELASICAKLLLVDTGVDLQTPYERLELSKAHGDAEILRAQCWFEEHMRDDISIEDLCTVAGLNARTFSRRFQVALGQSPSEYVQKQRVESAKRLLETTRNSFAEITMAVGYEDTSSFHRCFKKITGISPGEYRSRFKIGDN